MTARTLPALVVALAIWMAPAPGAAAGGDRTLLIVLDAVPYSTMARLTEPVDAAGNEPLFADFGRPIPLISTFPSITSIALAGILHDYGLERSPGYEARFFDWQDRRRRGGGPLSYFRVTFPWREFFDWNRKGPLRNALHAIRPVRAGIKELERALASFEASSRETFSIYIADTDTAAHLFGPTGLDPILRALDGQLRALRERSGSGLRVALLSDHGLAGGEPLENVLPAVKRRIKDRGWRVTERLERKGDVVLTPYGLVSSFEAYAAGALVPALAGALGSVEGVDFCVAKSGGGWRLTAARQSVEFARRDRAGTGEWAWQLEGETGYGVAAVLAKVADSGIWTTDEDLLEATLTAPYPDPLYRLAAAFEAVQNPASVICSTTAGSMYGALATERSARWTKGALRWTHGALHRDASLGFMMASDAAGLRPAAVRHDRGLNLLLHPQPTRVVAR
ncbi:MAG: hypothetical protein O7A98_06125 [Acidobacteria bacterium]|nr:hypothetical protein [Acidobacteriota bacterium]